MHAALVGRAVQVFRSLPSMPVSHPIPDLILYRIAVRTDCSRTDSSTQCCYANMRSYFYASMRTLDVR